MTKKLRPPKSQKPIKANSKLAQDQDQRLVKPNSFLETQRPHQEWFHPNTMGKQRGKPRYDMAGKKVKKPQEK